MSNGISKALIATTLVLSLTACSKGGKLVLDTSGVVKTIPKTSPVVAVDQGGKASIVQTGQTTSTGVHGYVSVQAVKARTLNSVAPGGNKAVINTPQSHSQLFQ